MQHKARKLFVPANVSLEAELLPGVSVKESMVCIVLSIVTIVLSVLLFLLFKVPLWVLVIGNLLVFIVNIGIRAKLPGEVVLSILDYLKIMLKFRQEQKRLPYIYRREQIDFWEE